ncbi:MAG: hypothetical protein Q9227_004317 [Pyrenula ochraceoflavens]
MSHSKRNTSRPDFTSHERSLLRNSWGSQRTRLTRDSYLPFGSCRLCLLPAREPVVACSANGDLFCKECAVADLLAQRKEIKRLEKEWDREQEERKEAALREEREKRDRDVQEFERGYLDSGRGAKRKRDDYAEDSKGRKRILMDGKETEKAESATSFWIPGSSATSNAASESSAKPEKLHPLCPASTPSKKHPYSLKSLLTVHFTTDRDTRTKDTISVCPSCRKALNNSSRAVLAKPCGHVICKPCVQQFMRADDTLDPHAPETSRNAGLVQCYVCETDVTERPNHKESSKEKDKIRPGLIEISSEGTGFAGGGSNMAKKEGVAFLG